MKHNPLLLSAILTLCVIAISAVLVGHFVHLNYEYIMHPETSPGYNENTPFGDGGDVWREQGIHLPTTLLSLLVVFNGIGLVMHFCASSREWRVFLIVSVFVMLAVATGELLGISLLYVLFSLFSVIFMFPMLLLVPAGIVCAIVFLVQKKPILSLHTVLLALSMAASCSFELFSCYLYLD